MQTGQRNDRRSRDKAVEQHGNSIEPRRQDRAGDGGEFAPAQRRRHAERIGENGAMKIERRLDRRALARQS